VRRIDSVGRLFDLIAPQDNDLAGTPIIALDGHSVNAEVRLRRDGDELNYLLSGEVTVVVEAPGGDERHSLDPVMPSSWHGGSGAGSRSLDRRASPTSPLAHPASTVG